MIKKISLLSLSAFLIFSTINCKDKEKLLTKEEQKTPVKRALHEYGKLTMTVDPSFKNLAQSLADIYMVDYPDVKIEIKEEIEEKAIKDFYEGEIPLLMVSKPLTKAQQQHLFDKTRINYVSSVIALDATIFITSVDNPVSSITKQDIKENLYHQNPKITFVYDHPNSANYNTVNDKLKLTVGNGTKVTAMGDAEKVIDFLQKDKTAIGIIGLNILSDKGNPKIEEYLKKIKILSIVDDKGNAVQPTIPNLKYGVYPFYREIYLLKNEIGFGIGAGYSRFAGSQRGQKIVTRESLQPYFIYKREVQINHLKQPLQ
ncbi:substrate-binding domain-containing protein [Empedobacter brevis]|uniref:Substrate-binding domain-containing protein n=1 Tax=Empedobacter brevis TaxID=247 RepID=A0AAJ1V6X9_9FLAO|nr:substrate-binding domain-containing protein [Empedobacter brevis]MDM1071854.1 substrate-binding domain-containing protein [Empedobacter brevis]